MPIDFLGIGHSSKLEKFAEAMGHFQSAVEAFQHVGDEKEEAAVYFSKAWTMRSFGDFDQALALVTQALSMDSSSDAFRVTSLGFKADLEAMNGQLKEAKACYRECAELCRARDDSYHLSAALTSLGKVCVKQRNLDEAEEHLKEAFHLAKVGRRRSGGIANIMRCLAALDCLRSEKADMLRWYKDALELVSEEEATGRPGSGRKQALLRDMGLAYEWLGDLDTALTKLKEAEAVFEADWSAQAGDHLRCTFREIEAARDLGPALQRGLLACDLRLVFGSAGQGGVLSGARLACTAHGEKWQSLPSHARQQR